MPLAIFRARRDSYSILTPPHGHIFGDRVNPQDTRDIPERGACELRWCSLYENIVRGWSFVVIYCHCNIIFCDFFHLDQISASWVIFLVNLPLSPTYCLFITSYFSIFDIRPLWKSPGRTSPRRAFRPYLDILIGREIVFGPPEISSWQGSSLLKSRL